MVCTIEIRDTVSQLGTIVSLNRVKTINPNPSSFFWRKEIKNRSRPVSEYFYDIVMNLLSNCSKNKFLPQFFYNFVSKVFRNPGLEPGVHWDFMSIKNFFWEPIT